MPIELYNKFIDDITFQTCLLFEVNDPDIIESFRDSLEYGVLEEIIRCKDEIKPISNRYKHGPGTTDGFLKTALIASGISKDGTLPFKYEYKVNPLINDDEMSCYAMRRYKEIEDEVYGEDYMLTAVKFAFNSIDKDYVDMEETLKGFFYLNDRTSNLMLDIDAFLVKDAMRSIWSVEKKIMREKKLDNSLCIKICNEICDFDDHYDYNTRNALIGMALADFHLYLDGDLSMNEIDKIHSLIDSVKSDDENHIVNRYAKEFDYMLENECRNYKYKRKIREV